jgi:FkbM family methyltransferase
MNVAFVRRMAEIILGPIVIFRKLPEKAGGGAIAVSANVGGLKYLFKPSHAWDPELINIAFRLVRKGDCVWDIGANVGLFSKAAAYCAGPKGQVLSVEADIDAVRLLNRTCRRPSHQEALVTVIPAAISDTVGFVRFSIAARARAANSIEGYGSTQTGGVAEIRTLPCVTLDNLLEHFPAPVVVKIDVEGAELRVLAGSKKLLGQVRPVIYCEICSELSDQVTQLLLSHGYRLWDGSGFSGTSSKEIFACRWNTVAIPTEKVSEYSKQFS